MPVNLPDGWEFDKVFGDSNAQPASAPAGNRASLARSLAKKVAALTMAAPSQEVAAEIASGHREKRRVVLPQTATPADRNIVLGVLFLLLAAMIWMTSRMWRGAGKSALAVTRRKSSNFNLLP